MTKSNLWSKICRVSMHWLRTSSSNSIGDRGNSISSSSSVAFSLDPRIPEQVDCDLVSALWEREPSLEADSCSSLAMAASAAWCTLLTDETFCFFLVWNEEVSTNRSELNLKKSQFIITFGLSILASCLNTDENSYQYAIHTISIVSKNLKIYVSNS